MKLKMFAIYDVKADCYLTPFFFPANGQALRAFGDLANDSNSIIGRHPVDYKLCLVGEFDDSDGEFLPGGCITLAWAADLVERSKIVPLGGVANG